MLTVRELSFSIAGEDELVRFQREVMLHLLRCA